MNKTILIVLFLLSCYSLQNPKKYVYVTAESGLVLRSSHDQKSVKITLLPYLSELEVIENSPITEKIDGVLGKWVKVKYKDKIGFVFDRFIESKNENIERNSFCKESIYELRNVPRIRNVGFKIDPARNFVVRDSKVTENLAKNERDKFIIIVTKNNHYSSKETKEKIFGKIKTYPDYFLSEWDHTGGDFINEGFNLYVYSNLSFKSINFHPINSKAKCLYSVVASYAYPEVTNKYLNNSIYSFVRSPECDFANYPKFTNEDSIIIEPKKFVNESFLRIRRVGDIIEFKETCNQGVPNEFKKDWDAGKDLEFDLL